MSVIESKHINVNGYVYNVVHWVPGMPVIIGDRIAIDTETEYIIPGTPIKPVLEQVCCHKSLQIHMIEEPYMDAYNEELFTKNELSLFVFHNCGFDLDVMGMKEDNFCKRPYLLKAMKAGRITDTGIRFLLHQLALGKAEQKWNLAYAALKILHYEVPKDEEIRTTFRQGMLMTEEHLLYAAKDAAVTAQLLEMLPGPYATEWYHVAGLTVLGDIQRNGMLVDMDYMRAKKHVFEEIVEREEFVISHWGYYPGRPGNRSIHQGMLSFLEKECGITLPRTESGLIACDKEVMEEHFGLRPHPFIQSLRETDHATKMLSTYLNEAHIGVDTRVHSRYEPLKKTGRTSSGGPNMQNVPRKEGLRGIYIAPPGHVLFACDYAQLELCTLAESNYVRFGESKMLDLINEGHDLHMWFGQKIKEVDTRDADALLLDGEYRQMAKAANFGLPGGLGVKTFQTYAATTYGVEMELETCTMLKELWLETFPENKEHLKPPKDTRFKGEGGEERYLAQTINGRIRRGATYCSACNYPFQGLAADGAKVALWYLYIEGFKIVNFIHDEVIIEFNKKDNVQKLIKRVEQLMIYGMMQVVKHVTIKTEGVLMERWYKEADSIYSDSGELLIWSPELAEQLKALEQ